jgi:hypothetical protein
VHVPWSDGRCIFCASPASTSVDHVIPESIGGRLTSCFECASCGPSLGTRIEGALRTTAEISFAVDALAGLLPDGGAHLLAGQQYFATRGTAAVVFTRTPDSFRLVEGLRGETLNLTDAKSEAMLRAHLRREGIGERAIEETIIDLRARPVDEPFEPAAGYQIIRRTVSAEELRPAGAGPLLQGDVFALIAYRFLALVNGSAILDDRLDSVRSWFRGETPQPESCVVTQGTLGDFSYRPKHGIRVRALPTGGTEVRVAFFGTLCGDVAFEDVSANSAVAYALDLVTRDETLADLSDGDG